MNEEAAVSPQSRASGFLHCGSISFLRPAGQWMRDEVSHTISSS